MIFRHLSNYVDSPRLEVLASNPSLVNRAIRGSGPRLQDLFLTTRPVGPELMLEHGQSRFGGVSPPVAALGDAFSERGFGHAEV
jgi:hypothetical protein